MAAETGIEGRVCEIFDGKVEMREGKKNHRKAGIIIGDGISFFEMKKTF